MLLNNHLKNAIKPNTTPITIKHETTNITKNQNTILNPDSSPAEAVLMIDIVNQTVNISGKNVKRFMLSPKYVLWLLEING